MPGDGKNAEKWSSSDKFAVVLETATLNEAELSEYCRKKGLYPEQIEQWKQSCVSANATEQEQTKVQRERAKRDQKKIKTLEKELNRKEKALAEAAALLVLQKKSPGTLGGVRGRLIPHNLRCQAVALVDEAVDAGARQSKACEVLEISVRTYQRWRMGAGIQTDRRIDAKRPRPSHALTQEERQQVLDILNRPEFASMPPSQVVPCLADQGTYICSESTMYRILHEAKQQNHRGRDQQPKRKPLSTHEATGPNEVWCWDITWLPEPAKGVYFYLYLMLDVFSRKIVGWEIHEEESVENASRLLRKACMKESIITNNLSLVLHSNNGNRL